MKASLVLLVILSACTFLWDRAGDACGIDNGEAGLMAAVAAGDADGVVRRLEAGAPLVDDRGTPVVVWAAWQGQTRVLDALLEHGADVNARTPAGWTALMMAVMAERTDVVAALLGAGADVGVRTEAGATALSIALDREDEELAGMLERAEAGRRVVVAAGR